MRKFLLNAALALTCAASVFSEAPFFSGSAGILTNLRNDYGSSSFKPELYTQGFFSGQVDFSGKFFLRGEAYVEAEDLFNPELFSTDSAKNSYFRIEELSGTLKLNSGKASHYLSAYIGRFEPFGSEVFLQRQFGIESISSRLTESFHGLSGASVYPMYTAGGSYVAHPETNVALGLYVYKNSGTNTRHVKNPDSINADLRFAGISNLFTLDLSLGAGFTYDDNKESSEGFVIKKQGQIHGSLMLMVGNMYKTSMFIQTGVGKIKVGELEDDEDAFCLSDLYLLIEPRILFNKFWVDMTLFNIPANCARDMIYLNGIYMENTGAFSFSGGNLTFRTENMFPKAGLELGVHATFAITGTEVNKAMDGDLEVLLTPYASIPAGKAELKTALSVNMTNFGENPEKAVQLIGGFKTKF